MKKETINTFDGGLNKDLNPIVTPNNILTDNLNGTFITFNGDELSLQNDAGNTKIPGPDNIDFVKLSEGFYPIGVREYGGVLYIVSGKKVYDENGEHLVNEDQVEFGSYPSPENSGYTTFHGEKTTVLSGTDNILYKSFVINDDYFKTGRFISFNVIPTEPSANLNNVQTDVDLNRLYIIKLLLQLDNGTIDLTDDVWTKFNSYREKHPEDTANHWLLSSRFEYYCPYSYKGRLAIKVVMSEPIFKLIRVEDVDTSGSTYSVKFDLDIQNTSALSVFGYEVIYHFDNDSELTLGNTSIPQDKKITIDNIPTDKEILYYTIIPKFRCAYGGDLDWSDLPFEFKELYNIQGTILLSEKYKEIGFNHEDYECIPESGLKRPRTLTLVGQNGYISPDLSYNLINTTNPNGLPYAFLLRGYENNNLYKSLGVFDIVNKYPVIDGGTMTIQDNALKSTMINKAQQTIAEVFDPSCSESMLHLKFSAPLDMTDRRNLAHGSLTIYQDNNLSPNSLSYDSPDGRNFYIKIDSTDNVHISFSNTGFGSFVYTISKEVLDVNKTYEIGLAVKFENEYTGDIKENQKEFTFLTADIDLKSTELGHFIHDQFGTNINSGYKIVRDPETAIREYTFTEGRISFMEGSYAGYFYTTLTDENYVSGNTNTVYYPYKIVNYNGTTVYSNISPNEYMVITRSGAPRGTTPISNEYIKIGNEELGYILFKIKDRLSIARVVSRNVYSDGSYGGENRSGRSSVGSRTSSRR